MSAFRAALVAVAAAALTAACAAGQDAQTANVRPTQDGTQGSVGNIRLEGVAMHAPTGAAYRSGADVPLTVYIANDGDTADTLTGVSSPAFSAWNIQSGSADTGSSGASPSASIGAGLATGFSQHDIGTGDQTSPDTLLLTGLSGRYAPLYPGSTLKITFTFAKAGQTTLVVPVQISTNPNPATVPPLPTSTA